MSHENQDHLIHQILASGGPYDDLLHRPLLEATRQIGQGLPVSAALRIQVLDKLTELWKNQPFGEIRSAISNVFEEIIEPEFANEVSTRLLEIHDIESACIANQLGKNEEAAGVLIALSQKEIEDPGDEDYILAALIELGEIGEKAKACSFLLEIARNPRHEDSTRVCAIQSIAKFITPRAEMVSALLEMARDAETEPWVRVTAARSLAKSNEADLAIPILREIAANPKVDNSDRAIAATHLGKADEKDLAISILSQLLHDPQTHEYVACCIAEDLVNLGQRGVGQEFLVTMGQLDRPCANCKSAKCSCMREIVYEKLIRLGEQGSVISLLLPVLQDETITPYGRITYATILAKLGKIREVLPVFLDIARSVASSEYVHGQALLALAKWGERNEDILTLLLNTAQNEDIEPHKRMYAFEALGIYGDSSPKVLEFLAETARTTSERSLRFYACEALWKLTNGNTHPESNTC